LDINILERQINSKTKIIMFNNATNPTGALYSEEEILAILKIAKRNNIVVISDEVYSSLVYDSNKFISMSSFVEYKDNVVIIQSCSKGFAMTGWRIGFVLANENIVNKVVMLQGQTTSGASTVGQWVALEAVINYKEITSLVKSEMQKRCDLFFKKFNQISQKKIQPVKSSLYSFVSISTMTSRKVSSLEFCSEALDLYNVALVPGIAFGQEGYVRFSFGEKESEIEKALEMLFDYSQSLA
jgi:aspartate/methionine/tyrosine aminotransferase